MNRLYRITNVDTKDARYIFATNEVMATMLFVGAGLATCDHVLDKKDITEDAVREDNPWRSSTVKALSDQRVTNGAIGAFCMADMDDPTGAEVGWHLYLTAGGRIVVPVDDYEAVKGVVRFNEAAMDHAKSPNAASTSDEMH